MPDYTDFTAMNRPEATSYLSHFLTDQQGSLTRLASEIELELAFSPNSLEPVWDAIVPKLAWRAGYKPPALGEPGPRVDGRQLEAPEVMPTWFHHPSGPGYARFSADTLWLIDGTGRYLGEVLVRTSDGRWETGHARSKGYMLQNQPVIAGAGAAPISPFQTCAVLAARALRQGPEQGPRTLIDAYNAIRTSG